MQSCVEATLSSSFTIWMSGEKLDIYCFYGIRAVWIGRAAKTLALLAALPIFLDIIGEVRLRNAADRIHRRRAISGLYRHRQRKYLASISFDSNANSETKWWWTLITASLFSLTFSICWQRMQILSEGASLQAMAVTIVGTILVAMLLLLLELFFLKICLEFLAGLTSWTIETWIGNRKIINNTRVFSAALIVISFAIDLVLS